jgi:acetoacetyl-CoA synthetase
MPLFVVLPENTVLGHALIKLIKTSIREELTPRHVPDEVIQIQEVPYTISGKKTETPVKKILMGKDVSDTLNKDALKNPDSLHAFIRMAESL